MPGMSVEEVLVFTREAADAVKATPMDRCEDVEPNPTTGKVYVACTNNTQRGTSGKPGADAANPRPIAENAARGTRTVTSSRSPSTATGSTRRPSAGTSCCCAAIRPTQRCRPTSPAGTGRWRPISCPDNVAFDSDGNLWISTDGAPGTIKKADGLFKVPLEGEERGHVQQFLAVPVDAETCGPVIHDTDDSVFVAVQHPGEDGTWAEQRSYFPDYVAAGRRPDRGDWRGPRPSVVQVTKKKR